MLLGTAQCCGALITVGHCSGGLSPGCAIATMRELADDAGVHDAQVRVLV